MKWLVMLVWFILGCAVGPDDSGADREAAPRNFALRAGADWLIRCALSEGYASADGMPLADDPEFSHTVNPTADLGLTGLSMMALCAVLDELGGKKDEWALVRRCARWITSQQASSGKIGTDVGTITAANHMFGLLGLCSAWKSGIEVEQGSLDRAYRYMVERQGVDGGWGYWGIGESQSNTFVTSVALWASLEYLECGGHCDLASVADGIGYLTRGVEPETGRVGYGSQAHFHALTGNHPPRPTADAFDDYRPELSESLTAGYVWVVRRAAASSFALRNSAQGLAKSESVVKEAHAHQPGQKFDYVFGLWKLSACSLLRRRAQDCDCRDYVDELLAAQYLVDRVPCRRGSWPIDDPWADGEGGAFYSTALALLSLCAAHE